MTNKARFTLAELNGMTAEEFVKLVGPVFEHSPWISEAVVEQRPFPSARALHEALDGAVQGAGEERQVALISAHPDLVGRAAQQGTLTAESKGEQASAGLDLLTVEEAATFQRFNGAYRERFGFPFVICARLHKKEAILAGFEARLPNTRAQEIETALEEISRIAWLRLQDIISG